MDEVKNNERLVCDYPYEMFCALWERKKCTNSNSNNSNTINSKKHLQMRQQSAGSLRDPLTLG